VKKLLYKLKIVRPTLYWIYYGGTWADFFGKKKVK